MRFKVDENLPEEVSHLLRAAGWDCLSVVEQQLRGAEDLQIATVCDEEDRILVTLDRGFSNIKAYPPEQHPGYVVFRLTKQDKRHVIDVTRRLIPAFRERSLRNELWIVEDDRIRIRGS